MKFRFNLTFIALALTPFLLKSQSSDSVLVIKYDWACTFCASRGFNSALYISENSSVFTFKDKTNNGGNPTIIDTTTKFVTYNFETDSIYEKAVLNSIDPKGILIDEKRERIDWVLIDSAKIFEDRSCKLAIGDFRGRKYIVWYDPKVLCKAGPWKLHGLPGAIIYAHDSTNQLSFQANSISTLPIKAIVPVFNIPNLTRVSRRDYREEREKIYDRMENIKPPDTSNVTFDIKVTRNYFEFY